MAWSLWQFFELFRRLHLDKQATRRAPRAARHGVEGAVADGHTCRPHYAVVRISRGPDGPARGTAHGRVGGPARPGTRRLQIWWSLATHCDKRGPRARCALPAPAVGRPAG